MVLTYFKRYRMEIELGGRGGRPPKAGSGYRLLAWRQLLLDAHADAKYKSFCLEIDANVFPCLGDRDGCRRLMTEIARRSNFVPEATWLIQFASPLGGVWENVGTVQGIRDGEDYGAIQNLGVAPAHRGRGLGSVLLQHALQGFAERGLRRAYLEVTAQNSGAVRLYERVGFRRVRTVYKAADPALA